MRITLVKTITHLERLRNSRDGNPAYRVTFADGTSARTAPDAACAGVLTNSEYRVSAVKVTYDGGQIATVELIPGSCGARAGDNLHHLDGTHRTTAPTANGRDVARHEALLSAHLHEIGALR